MLQVHHGSSDNQLRQLSLLAMNRPRSFLHINCICRAFRCSSLDHRSNWREDIERPSVQADYALWSTLLFAPLPPAIARVTRAPSIRVPPINVIVGVVHDLHEMHTYFES